MGITYHEGMRRLQDRFGTRPLADRLDERLGRSNFTDEDRTFIEGRSMFFLASANGQGQPDCSYKGGDPGFIRITAVDELAFPSYDGNGMFRSLGNILVSSAVGLLFIDFESPRRLRVNGVARIAENDELLGAFTGAQHIVRVRAERIFPNCSRYIQSSTPAVPSPDVPRLGHVAPVPKWKTMEMFADVVPLSKEPEQP